MMTAVSAQNPIWYSHSQMTADLVAKSPSCPLPRPAQPEEPVPVVPPMEEEGMSWWVILLIVLAVLLLIGAGYALAARQFNLKWHEIITNF